MLIPSEFSFPVIHHQHVRDVTPDLEWRNSQKGPNTLINLRLCSATQQNHALFSQECDAILWVIYSVNYKHNLKND